MEKIKPIHLEVSQDPQQAEQRFHMLEQLVGGISHDFNNLLMVIRGNMELLGTQLESLGCTDPASRRISAVLKAVDTASLLTKRLTAFSRMQSLNPELLRVAMYLNDFAERIRPTLPNHVQLKVLIDENPLPILVDAILLENALVNLIVNARDAIKSKGEILISVTNVGINENEAMELKVAHGDYVKISVHDNGTGMPPHIQAHIFEPFFTTKQQGKGTGLGLSMVYGFVGQSKGFISLNSIMSQGTTINIYLPVAHQTSEEMDSSTTDVIKAASSNGETILLVDDEVELLNLARDYLSSLGYKVLSAETGHRALSMIKSQKIDLLFSDIIMPGFVSGVQLIHEATKIQPKIKTLLTTGYPKTALEIRTSKPKEFNVLTKPYKMEQLSRKIREILDA